ncbi:MAG: M23 family metallopeptidase [Bacteroidetes bacterium]|nr:M23 family metallopeptidase [Bacteroidota bacterium]
MVSSNEHHKSKKKIYTFILISEEEARNSMAFRCKRWHLVVGAVGVVAMFFGIFWALIVYTPVGYIFPITSPGLRNQYTQQLVELHQRLSSMMDELVVLRTYNAKLRKALGDSVSTSNAQNHVVQTQNELPQNIANDDIGVARYQFPPQGSWYDNSKQVPMKVSGERIQRMYQFPAIFPTQGYVTRGFEPSINHYGIDIAGKSGAPIYAAADGIVVYSGWTQNDGYVIILSHVDGFMTLYKHNDAVLKFQGTQVRRGETIALLGNTGETSRGPHLHFEIWKDGLPVDPAAFIINYSL